MPERENVGAAGVSLDRVVVEPDDDLDGTAHRATSPSRRPTGSQGLAFGGAAVGRLAPYSGGRASVRTFPAA